MIFTAPRFNLKSQAPKVEPRKSLLISAAAVLGFVVIPREIDRSIYVSQLTSGNLMIRITYLSSAGLSHGVYLKSKRVWRIKSPQP